MHRSFLCLRTDTPVCSGSAHVPGLLPLWAIKPAHEQWFLWGQRQPNGPALRTCQQCWISQHIWMGLVPAVCLNPCWGEVVRQVMVFWNETYTLGSFIMFLGAPKGFGCQRPWAPKSLGYLKKLPVTQPFIGSQTNNARFWKAELPVAPREEMELLASQHFWKIRLVWSQSQTWGFSFLPHQSRLAESYLCSFCLRLQSCPVPKTDDNSNDDHGESSKSGLLISMSCRSCWSLIGQGSPAVTDVDLVGSPMVTPSSSFPGILAGA